MYRFALRPRWIASHLLAVAVIVLFVNLGFWQLRRHDERAARNAAVVARTEVAPAAIDTLVTDTLGTGTDDVEELRFRRATATGRFTGETIVVDNRSSDGVPGVWVLSALDLDTGGTAVVNRGFLPVRGADVDPPAPPAGAVAVGGTLVPWDDGCGVRTDDADVVVGMACLDRTGASAAFGRPLLPVVLQQTGDRAAQVTSGDAASGDAVDPRLSAVPLPELDSGPHRSYAGQWFIFAGIVAVVYPLILRRVARDRARPDAGSDAGPDTGPAAGTAFVQHPVNAVE